LEGFQPLVEGPKVKNLSGKKALVTGAAGGIGRAIALQLSATGVKVCLVDIDADNLAAVLQEIRLGHGEAISYSCDVSRSDQIDACIAFTLATWGDLDILVNNAGICCYGPIDNTPQAMFDKVLAVNLQAPIRFSTGLLSVLKRQQESHILNVASMYGLFATNRCAAYHTSKFGLVGFSEALRAECARDGLGVTTLCPGFVNTELFTAMETDAYRQPRRPPAWVTTTPEHVARKAITAIKKNQGLVTVTALARFGYLAKRVAPSLLGRLYAIGKSKKKQQLTNEANKAA